MAEGSDVLAAQPASARNDANVSQGSLKLHKRIDSFPTNTAAQVGEARFHLGIGERGVDLLVEHINNLCVGVPGRAEAIRRTQ